jgi:hypothetical protein
VPTLSILRPSKIYPSWNFWVENLATLAEIVFGMADENETEKNVRNQSDRIFAKGVIILEKNLISTASNNSSVQR